MNKKQERHNKGKPNMTKAMLMPKAMEALVAILEAGEQEYGPAKDKGWMDYDPEEVLDSLARHVIALVNGQTHDPKSGHPHAVSIVFNAAAYIELTVEDSYFDL